jgi:sugar lactone lactonase YvrE
VRRATAICGALAVLLLVGAAPAGAKERPRWDTRVLALVGKPGFPARAYVAPNDRIYEGTYANPNGGSRPSLVREYLGDGTILHTWVVPGQNLSGDQGVQVATSDSRGRLVLLDRTPARVLLLNRHRNTQRKRFHTYARFRDLPPCVPGTGPNCSPTTSDDPPVPNYAAWGPGGALYVTDYLQAVIWRVPPGGGKATVWLADPRLDGGEFGTTGIVLKPDHRTLLVMQQSSAGGADGNPSTGKLYSVRILPRHRHGALQRVWQSQPLDGPDGFWIAQSGRIYAALAGSNQIAVIGPGGRDLQRFPAVPGPGFNGSSVPFDTPSSVMFLGTRLIVANQSFFSGDSTHQAILDVESHEGEMPEFIPRTAGLARRHR